MSALLKIQQAGFSLSTLDGMLFVTPAKNLTDQHRQFIKDHKEQIISELNAAKNDDGLTDIEKTAILRWLTFIGENSQPIIDDVLSYCTQNPEGLAYYLERSKEVDRYTKVIKQNEAEA